MAVWVSRALDLHAERLSATSPIYLQDTRIRPWSKQKPGSKAMCLDPAPVCLVTPWRCGFGYCGDGDAPGDGDPTLSIELEPQHFQFQQRP